MIVRLIDCLDHGARLWPNRPCLVDGSITRTYREVANASHQIAGALIASGVRVESRCAVLSGNSALAFEAVFGILRAGATWLPVNARAPSSEIQSFLERHRCQMLFFHSAFEEIVGLLSVKEWAIKTLVCLDAALPGASRMSQWILTQPAIAPDVRTTRDNVAVIKATGGTTGEAKSVMQTHGNFETMAASFLTCMPFAEPPVHLVAAPMTHGAGSICFPLLACGATNVILPRAEPGAVLQSIEAHGVNVLFLPPTVIYMMLAHPDLRNYDYSTLKYFIYAAAPMSTDKLRRAIEVFGPVMSQTYGQAEAPMICTFLSPADHCSDDPRLAARLRSCGRPTPFTAVEVMDEQGQLLPPKERGEIVVRGGLVFAGYFEDAEATRLASLHGWHHTGDIGYRDEDGYIYIVDRKRDMIISGGFNVYPSEIEQVIWKHAAVQDCAVIGVPDDKWGESVKAVVELKPGASVSTDELREFCRRALGGVKAPKSIEIWPELPRSAVGKVLKKDIRRIYWTGRDRDI